MDLQYVNDEIAILFKINSHADESDLESDRISSDAASREHPMGIWVTKLLMDPPSRISHDFRPNTTLRICEQFRHLHTDGFRKASNHFHSFKKRRCKYIHSTLYSVIVINLLIEWKIFYYLLNENKKKVMFYFHRFTTNSSYSSLSILSSF